MNFAALDYMKQGLGRFRDRFATPSSRERGGVLAQAAARCRLCRVDFWAREGHILSGEQFRLELSPDE